MGFPVECAVTHFREAFSRVECYPIDGAWHPNDFLHAFCQRTADSRISEISVENMFYHYT